MKTPNVVIIYLSVCVLMSTGLIHVKYVKYCGPRDKTFKYKITPWPYLIPGKTFNATVTLTPAVDIFSATAQYTLTSEKTHQVIFRGTDDKVCKRKGGKEVCGLAKGETVTRSFHDIPIRDIPAGFKGIFSVVVEVFNQDHIMWFCAKGEAEFS